MNGLKVEAFLSEDDKRRIVVAALIAMFLAALDQTIVAPALPSIGHRLGDADWVSWVISAYLLTSTAVTPLYGKLADLRGRRLMLYVAIAAFLVGSVVCALAPTMAVLIIGRSLQGLGGGGLMAVVQTIIGDVAPPRERSKYMVYIAAVWATSSLGGPVLGGVLAEHVHWSVIFWINVPIGAIAILLSLKPLARLPFHRQPHRLDLLGSALIATATVLMLLALTWGGVTYPWSSPEVAGLLVLSVVVYGLFAFQQTRPAEPLLPPRIITNTVIACASGASFLSSSAFLGLTVFYPTSLQLIGGFGASSAGFAMMALMAGSVVGSNTTGRILRRGGPYKRMPIVGTFISIAGLLLLAATVGHVVFGVSEAILVVTGFGFGTLFPMAVVVVQNAAEPRDLGTATAALSFVRSLGGVIAIACFGAILSTAGLGTHIGNGTAALSDEARAGIVVAFRAVFVVAAVIQVGTLALLFRLEERPLRGRAEPPPVTGEAS
jgi:EmrB/QacA subfamily drug resistance transporter